MRHSFFKKNKKNKKKHKTFCQRKPESVFIVTRWWKLLQSDTSKALIDSKEDNKICKGVEHFFVWSKQLISNVTHHPRKTGKNVGRNYWESSMSYGFSWTEDDHSPQHECAICQEMLANANMMASKLRKH